MITVCASAYLNYRVIKVLLETAHEVLHILSCS